MIKIFSLFIGLMLVSLSARSEILESYDSIDEFRISGSSWMSAVVGSESVLLERPVAVAVDNNLVFFVDDGLNALYVYDLVTRQASTLSSAFGKIESQEPRLFISNRKALFVVDPLGNQILKFNFQGELFTIYDDPLNLNTPVGVCVNPNNGHLYVADSFYSHIIEFGEGGDPLAIHGLRRGGQTQAGNNIIGMACNDTGMFVVSKLSQFINVFSYSGELIRQIPRPEVHNPTAVTIDQFDRVYISDAFDDRIRIYDQSKMIAEFGAEGNDALTFRAIKGLWADKYFLYVADSLNRRIQVLSINRYADQK